MDSPPADPNGAAMPTLADAFAADLRATLAHLAQPLRDTAVSTARLVKHVGTRLDALSLDLARDVGAVSRDAQALAGAARDQAQTVFDQAQTVFGQAQTAFDQAQTLYRATPRAARLAQAAAPILARHRWLRLAAAAR